MSENQYTVHVEIQGVSIKEHHDDSTIKSCLLRLLRGPSRLLVNRVLVVDQLDCTNFLYEDGDIIFPSRNQLEVGQ